MESKITAIRLSAPLRREAQRLAKAAGVSLGEWIRRLIERETGIQAEMKEGGFAHMSKKRRREIASSGGKAKAAGKES